MRTELQNACALFADNRELVAKHFAWENSQMGVVAAAFYTTAHRTIVKEDLEEAKKELKKLAGAFSDFRSHMTMPMIAKMALSGDAGSYFEGVKEAYDGLKKGNMFSMEYRVLTAMILQENRDSMSLEQAIERTNEIKEIVKKNHPMITSSEDLAMFALLALTGREVNAIVSDFEECHKILLEKFPMHHNAVQSLAMTLATVDLPANEKCEKVYAIFEALKDAGRKYSKGMELASLGTLIQIDASPAEIAQEIMEADDYLHECKGFGALGVGTIARMMYAVMLVSDSYTVGEKMNAAAVNATLAAAIATQAAMLCAISAASVSATNS